jgi:hypothetical protein
MSSKKKHKRTAEETLDAIDQQHAAEELARIKAMSDAEVADSLRAAGADPDAIGQRAVALVAKLEAAKKQKAEDKKAEAARKRAAWQPRAIERFRRAQEVLTRPRAPRGLSRDELLARIRAAAKDPRFSEPIAIVFRDTNLDTSSEEVLEAILDAIEDLADLSEVDG